VLLAEQLYRASSILHNHPYTANDQKSGETLIYLASRSPRRRELLKQIGVSFEVLVLREHRRAAAPTWTRLSWRTSSCRRLRLPSLPRQSGRGLGPGRATPAAQVPRARRGHRRLRRRENLGKPADPADAARMLRLLSGREHRGSPRSRSSSRRAPRSSEREPGALLRAREARARSLHRERRATDKAGAYAIRAARGLRHRAARSYSGIMGLPVVRDRAIDQDIRRVTEDILINCTAAGNPRRRDAPALSVGSPLSM